MIDKLMWIDKYAVTAYTFAVVTMFLSPFILCGYAFTKLMLQPAYIRVSSILRDTTRNRNNKLRR